jgi:uncharacterized protein (TIGR02598 family)
MNPPLPPPAARRPGSRRGFTIVEVMVATAVMALVISTSITTLQVGFRTIDTARNTTIAGQVLQSLVEDLRLQTWTAVSALQPSPPTAGTLTGNLATFDTASNHIQSGSFTGYSAAEAAILNRFTITRTVTDAPGQTGMKVVVFTATWTGIDGRSHTVNYTTYYAQNGLYAYYTS